MSAPKLTETQQIVLCAAARRADRCVMLPPHLKGAAAQRVVKKLVDLGLIEEVRAGGDLPVWRRDHNSCPIALRITRDGSARIRTGRRGSGSSVLEADEGEPTKGQLSSPTPAGLAATREPPDVPMPALAPSKRRSSPCFGAPRRDHPDHRDGGGLAAALGPWVFLRSGAQEARIGTRFRQGRRQATLPDRTDFLLYDEFYGTRKIIAGPREGREWAKDPKPHQGLSRH
jgi:hypothetical protein